MSKSLGNYIGVEEPPNDMYGKLMSLPDGLIVPYFEYLTDTPDGELAAMSQDLATSAVNPMELKKRLAWEVTAQFHERDAANAAQVHFEQTVQQRELPQDMPQVALAKFVTDAGETVYRSPSGISEEKWSDFLVEAHLATSTSQAKRLLRDSAVDKILPSGESSTLHTDGFVSGLVPGTVIKVGKRRFVRLVAQ
jgi:tyrosyl-tRNA synthetase